MDGWMDNYGERLIDKQVNCTINKTDKCINWIWSRRYMNRCIEKHRYVSCICWQYRSCLSIYISTSTRTCLLCIHMIYPSKHWPLHSFTHLPETFLSARNQAKNHLASIKKKRKYVYSVDETVVATSWVENQDDMKTHNLLPLSIPLRSIQGAQVEGSNI